MRGNVLIAGGSGLIGSRPTQLLLERDYGVAWLSRSRDTKASFRVWHWDPAKGTIEKGALDQVQYIINLSGANVNSRWTDQRRKLIIDSRVNSTRLLHKTHREQSGHDVRADRKSTRLNSSPLMRNSYAVFCLKKKTEPQPKQQDYIKQKNTQHKNKKNTTKKIRRTTNYIERSHKNHILQPNIKMNKRSTTTSPATTSEHKTDIETQLLQ